MRYVFLIFTLFVFSFAQLSKSGNSVIDRDNKLMWQDTKDNVTLAFTHTQSEKYCKELVLGGFANWRLPTMQEYKNILDLTRDDEIMIDKAFKHIIQDDYWTSDRTWLRNFGKYGYYLMIKSGHFYYQNRTYPKYARCVREL